MPRLSYACVLSQDVEHLARFYREVLQAEPQWTEQYAEFPTGGGTFSLWSVQAFAEVAGVAAAPNPGGGPIMLEFETRDVDSEYRRLQQLADFKIEFIIPPTTLPWGNRSIYFRDPEGNLLNLFSHA